MYVYIFRVPHGCVFSLFFYGDYNFVTAFDWKKKQQGTSRPNINVITVSTSSSLSLFSSSLLSSLPSSSYSFPRTADKMYFMLYKIFRTNESNNNACANAYPFFRHATNKSFDSITFRYVHHATARTLSDTIQPNFR